MDNFEGEFGAVPVRDGPIARGVSHNSLQVLARNFRSFHQVFHVVAE